MMGECPRDDVAVFVPLGALNALLQGRHSQEEEQRRLRDKIDDHRKRIQLLTSKTGAVDTKLAQLRVDHRKSMLSVMPRGVQPLPTDGNLRGGAGPRHTITTANTSSSSVNSSTSTRKLAAGVVPFVPSVHPRIHVARRRVAQLEDVMATVKEISAQGEFEDVIARTLSAAQKLVRTDKYTLGLLNERRNIVELFSVSGPLEHASSVGAVAATGAYRSDGFVAADGATTFGRVVMTGKLLHIEDCDAQEVPPDKQLNDGNRSDVNDGSGASGSGGNSNADNPRALLCLPITNAHNAVVGVLQVVAMAQTAQQQQQQKPFSSSPSPVFTEADRKGLTFLAVVAGAAIWNLILFRERQTAQGRIEGLLKLHRNISMEAVSSAVLDQVLSVCHELLGTERIGLFMKVEGEDELYIACAADIVRGEYVPLGKGIVGYVATTGETVITNDAYTHPRFDPTLDLKTGFVTSRILCLPVQNPDGEILAVLSAVNKTDNTDFSSEDAVFLKYAADAVGISLHKASLHHEFKIAQKLMEARLQFTTFISESTDIERFVDLVMALGKDVMACDRFGFLLIDHFKHELWITATAAGGAGIRTPMNRGLSGLVATTGQVVCTRDAYKHELFDPSVDLRTGYRTTSVLCMPVLEEQAASAATPRKVVAVAMCINKLEGSHVVAFTKTDRDIMEKYCHEVQFALARLSLDISYYKVVFDCNSTSTSTSTEAPPPPTATANVEGNGNGDATTPRMDGYSETDIISSIVHKYCQAATTSTSSTSHNTTDGNGPLDETRKPTTGPGEDEGGGHARRLAASASRTQLSSPAGHNDDHVIPFPREIMLPTGAGDILDRWDTNTLAMTAPEIALHCSVLFRGYGFLDAYHISNDRFAAFANNVATYYRANPFHNYQHGFQVLHSLHIMIRHECRKYFNQLELFAMLLAAVCHDIDHPGNTNEFELRTLSAMALTHNDDAVLERHHCRVTFIILNHKSAKILAGLDVARFKRVRQLIIACILATDMSGHFEKCKALEALTRRQLVDKRIQFMGILLHAADLSFHALPFAQAHDWSTRLLDEFQNQARAEHEQEVPSDAFMQHLDQRKTRLFTQLHLINYVARPIWLPLSSLCHHLRFYADELEKNFERYQQQLADYRLNAPHVPTTEATTTGFMPAMACSPPSSSSGTVGNAGHGTVKGGTASSTPPRRRSSSTATEV